MSSLELAIELIIWPKLLDNIELFTAEVIHGEIY